MDGMMLTTESTKKIVDQVEKNLTSFIENAQPDPQGTCTFAPYYDATLTEEEKANLVEVPMSSLIQDKVKNEQYKTSMSKVP